MTFSVTSSTVGVQPNTTSGVTTNQTTLGSASNTATRVVQTAPTDTKAFSPTSVAFGGTSTVTVTLANSNGSALAGAAFSDTLTGMAAVGGAAGGTCTGANSNNLAAGGTSLSFSGITIPANGTCTVTFNVTGATIGSQTNTTSGVTTTLTPTAGSGSNTAGLTVNYATPTVAKAFSPTSIQSGGTSVVTITITNPNTLALSGGGFTDTLTGMSAAGGNVTGSCGASPSSLSAGTTAPTFSGIGVSASNTCTVVFSVTSTSIGSQPNATSGVTTTQTSTAGSVSNTATLTVFAAPTVAKAFNPTSIQSGGSSVVTVTLTNSNATALTGGAFTDTLANMSALGGAVTGNCVGTAPNNLAAGVTALSSSPPSRFQPAEAARSPSASPAPRSAPMPTQRPA